MQFDLQGEGAYHVCDCLRVEERIEITELSESDGAKQRDT